MKIPYVAAVVLYTLTAQNAQDINQRRGHVEQVGIDGNAVEEGQSVPLVVVKTWHSTDAYEKGVSVLNGQVLLDGSDSLWITSVHEGESPGTWRWPEVQTPALKPGAHVLYRKLTQEPLPAIVTQVHEDGWVDLVALTGRGSIPVIAIQSAGFIENPDSGEAIGWYWPS